MLYKYAPYDRRDILENGLIRFTQPGAFNDPFELHPSFDLMSKADIARLPEAPGQEGQSGPKARLLTPEVMQAMMSALMPGIQRTIAATVQGEGFFSLNNNQIARSVFDSKFGVLSLTESPDDLLMWAHYADCHRGLALQFDENHEFFAPRVFEGHELSLTKVEYTDERPVLSYSTINSPRVFYRKESGMVLRARVATHSSAYRCLTNTRSYNISSRTILHSVRGDQGHRHWCCSPTRKAC